MYRQYRDTRVPTSLFEQTQYEVDRLFYATFPAARDAARNAAFEQDRQSDFAYSEGLHQRHPQQPFLSHYQTQLSNYFPPRPIENKALVYSHQQPFFSRHQIQPSYRSPPHPAPVYGPPNHSYHHQMDTESSQYPIPVHDREPTNLVYQSHISPPQLTTDLHETVSDGHPETPRVGFRQLNHQMNPPTLNFTNTGNCQCQLGIMCLDQFSDRSDPDSPQLNDQPHPSPSETSPITPSLSTPPPTEFLLNSAPSPSIGLSSLPSEDTPEEKKPILACLFCRGRKIVCGVPLPGIKKTCSQCWKRSLTCYYPTESRRGMRKKKPPGDVPEGDADVVVKRKKKKKIDK